MKKLISLITIIALLITALAIFSSCGSNKGAASVEATKLTENESITWSYSADTKTLKIIATSAEPADLPTFEKGKAPWFSIRTSAVKLELSNIAKISDYAFYSMYYIKEISFGSTVSEIGKCAFAFCASLTDITVPDGVTSIGESAFEGCTTLKTVKLPTSINSLGERAFAYNQMLTSVTIDEAYLSSLSTESFNSIFEGIAQPAITTIGANTPAEPAPEPEEPSNEDITTDSTDKVDSTDKNENETEAPAVEKPNDVTTIIAIIVLALVIIGLVVGGILLARSNKNQTKDSRTVRKNGNDKYNKNAKGKKK